MVKITMSSYNGGGIFFQVLMTILINIPLISFGMTVGWLSPNALILQSEQGVSDEEISWMASVTFLTAIPSVFLYGFAVDILGRKIALLCTTLPFTLCWALTLYSTQPWALITARAIAGMGASGSFIVPPLYVKEISQDSIRGALGSVMVLAQNVGYLSVYIISDYMSYNAVIWTCFAVPTLHFVVLLFAPESPSFDLSRGKVERATRTLAWLRGRSAEDPLTIKELEDLRLDEHSGNEEGNLFAIIVSDKATSRAFQISMVAVLAQEICGLFTLVMFSGKIFETAGGLELTSNQKVIILGCVQLAGSVIASCFVEKVGRKPLLTTSAYIISACMMVLGLWFYLHTHHVAVPGWIPTTAMCIAIFSDAAGLQPVPYVIMSEMFKFELRGLVTTIVMGLADLANFVELKVFHTIVLNLGIYSCFWIFAAISFTYSTFILFVVPETMGKSIDEILDELRNWKCVNFRNENKKRIKQHNNESDGDSAKEINFNGISEHMKKDLKGTVNIANVFNDENLINNSTEGKYASDKGKIIDYINNLDCIIADNITNIENGNLEVKPTEYEVNYFTRL